MMVTLFQLTNQKQIKHFNYNQLTNELTHVLIKLINVKINTLLFDKRYIKIESYGYHILRQKYIIIQKLMY